MRDQLDGKRIVPAIDVDFILAQFWDLHAGRQNGMGPNPLAWSEIDAWSRLRGSQPELWEMKAFYHLDRVIRSHSTKPKPEKPKFDKATALQLFGGGKKK